MRFLTALFIVFFLANCSPAKVFTTVSDNVMIKGSDYLFENDTVVIKYNFWEDRGIVYFEIFNKLSEPIYVDWKRSAFISNNRMMSYWQDETVIAESSTVNYKNYLSSRKIGISKAVKKERVSVIPPKTIISRSTYYILPKVTTMKTKFKVGEFSKNESEVVFRNYLAICNNEDFTGKITYIDNDFYVAKAKLVKMKSKQPSPDSFWIISSK